MRKLKKHLESYYKELEDLCPKLWIFTNGDNWENYSIILPREPALPTNISLRHTSPKTLKDIIISCPSSHDGAVIVSGSDFRTFRISAWSQLIIPNKQVAFPLNVGVATASAISASLNDEVLMVAKVSSAVECYMKGEAV